VCGVLYERRRRKKEKKNIRNTLVALRLVAMCEGRWLWTRKDPNIHIFNDIRYTEREKQRERDPKWLVCKWVASCLMVAGANKIYQSNKSESQPQQQQRILFFLDGVGVCVGSWNDPVHTDDGANARPCCCLLATGRGRTGSSQAISLVTELPSQVAFVFKKWIFYFVCVCVFLSRENKKIRFQGGW
jgi:hypothetical protein